MDKVLLKVAGIIALIVGGIFCLTIVGLIVGVPLVVGAVKFLNYAEMEDEELLKHKDTILVWSIVFVILITVAGVLGLVFYSQMNNVKPKEEPKKEIKEQPKKEVKPETKKEVKKEVKETKTTKKTTTTKKPTNKTTKTTSKSTPKKASTTKKTTNK